MTAALRVLQIGAVAIVFAASTHVSYDLDRFLVPKELVLHLTAALAGVCAWRSIAISRRDLALLEFMALSVLSALFATNYWLAGRALAVSASAVMLFFVARAVRTAGRAPALLNALALGFVLAAATSLLQAYGVWLDLFTDNRAPGGTLGNRNFIAHAAAFGYPVVLLAALRARRGFLFGCAGLAIVTASLVLTRSRGAWLAFGAMLLVFVGMLIVRRDHGAWRRFIAAMLFAGVGVAAALLIPNTLRWRSDNPYLESLNRVANYQEGSGRGRLIQYQRSLIMAARHPFFGVAPGNWAVDYPEYAARRDPSLDPAEPGMTSNPWPSSDWVAFASERGFFAAVILGLFFLSLMKGAWRAADGVEAAALLAMVVAVGVAGAFDAVLLLGLPAFLVWATCGALSSSAPEEGGGLKFATPAILMLILFAFGGAFRSAAQLTSMELLAQGSPGRAARIDPANYRARLRLARSGPRKQRCTHAAAAHALYPEAGAARELSRACD